MRFRLLKFGSLTCSACTAMAKAKTLEKFKERFPDVEVVKLDVSDETGESPSTGADGVDYATNYAISDEYEVQSLPTLVFEVEGLGEMARIEGAASIKQLAEAFEDARDDLVELAERAKRIPWGQAVAPAGGGR